MSDERDDVVLEALEEAIYQLGGSNYYTRDLEKAIAIQKAQALAIADANEVKDQWEYQGLSAGDEKIVNKMCESLAALDEVKK